MHCQVLGGTGIAVSSVVLGCGSIRGIGSPSSTRGKGLTVEEGRQQLDTATSLQLSSRTTMSSRAPFARHLSFAWIRRNVTTSVGSSLQKETAYNATSRS